MPPPPPQPYPAWLDRLAQAPEVHALAAALSAGGHSVARGARGSSTAVLSALLAAATGRPLLLVVAHLDEADEVMEDWAALQGAGMALDCLRFPAMEILPGETSVSGELLTERIAVAEKVDAAARRVEDATRRGTASAFLIVAPVQALMQPVPRSEQIEAASIGFAKGSRLSPQDLSLRLEGAQFQRVPAIENPGDYALRGGILDIFPHAALLVGGDGAPVGCGPLRLDFFGDELEAIFPLNPESLTPCGPSLSAVRLLLQSAEDLAKDSGGASLTTLLPERFAILMQERMELLEQARGYFERLSSPIGIVPPRTLFDQLDKRDGVEFNQYSSPGKRGERFQLPLSPLPTFSSDFGAACKELEALAQTHAVTVLCAQEAEAKRLAEMAEAFAPDLKEKYAVAMHGLHRGFVWQQGGADTPVREGKAEKSNADKSVRAPLPQLFVPYHEIVHRYEVKRKLRRVQAPQVATGLPGDAFLDLSPGDIVVHADHGLARFTGLRQLKRDGKATEYLTLEFADEATLHVPMSESDLLQKYIGGFSGAPRLSQLGGERWKKQKADVSDAVKVMASELLRVQAARGASPGTAFPADTPWMHAFESAFPFEETEDQLASIGAVKRDMEGTKPMDRLLCGDVGFGKTEVAIRAAFKCADAGKQAAVLVPTTVLAEQHGNSFRQRFAGYPFRVESLSRFKTAREQDDILDAVRMGKVDVVIGTHRLLSKDVEFKDLGLVVIDEEQKFGVEHKQKLLSLRLAADVLSMSATPIPRTLHMGMVGLRDISSLTTAPQDRRPVLTEVVPWNQETVQRAIVRELAREGQVFFVHNRVHDIHDVANRLRAMVPGARVMVGHGQMGASEMEEVMLAFTRHEADILVATTIIESGIDIPRANTIIIDRADMYGLAQLHQLRGRVGRWKHRAYCYLLLPEHHGLSDIAAKRLKAIENYSMLGAGFKIAMQDLEIRGAGNLLGKEQSGHIAAVGYEMYCFLLERETRKLRGEKVTDIHRCKLELPLAEGALPKTWIPSDRHRLAAYRRLIRAGNLKELDAVMAELAQAWGEAPKDARAFLARCELRLTAAGHGIAKIVLTKPDLVFTLEPGTLAKAQILFEGAPGRITPVDGQTLHWRPPEKFLGDDETLAAVLRKVMVRPEREAAQKPGTVRMTPGN